MATIATYKRCSGLTKSGKPCGGAAMPNGTCRMHNGGAATGLDHPSFKTGRYSKSLPARLLTRYQEALEDPELLALREDVALIDSRIADLLSRVDTGETGGFYAEVKKAWSQYTRPSDLIEQAKAGELMEQLLGAALTDFQAWEELGKQIDRRMKLVESERKRLVEMEQIVTVENLMVQVTAFTDVVRRNVNDPRTLAAIQREIEALIS